MAQCAAINFPAPKLSKSSQLEPSRELNLPVETQLASNAVPFPWSASEPGPIPESDSSAPTLSQEASLEAGKMVTGTLCLSELVITLPGNDIPLHAVPADERFACRLELDFTDVSCVMPVVLEYCLALRAKKFGERSRQVLGEWRGTVKPTEKMLCVAETRLPSPGAYRLEAIVTLVSPGSESPLLFNVAAAHASSLLHIY
jgi:hypothetical protein